MMQGIKFVAQLSPDSIKSMKEFANTFPEKVQKPVFKQAGKKASEAMVGMIKLLMPYNKNQKYKKPRQHMRDVVAYKVKTYRQSGRTLFIMGYKSKTTNLQTLVEKGNFLTSPRMTRHESNSGRVAKHAGFRTQMVPKQRRDGSCRSVAEQVRRRDNKRSTGSRAIGGGVEGRGPRGRFVKGGVAHSTGNFPKSKKPFAPITRAAKAMQGEIAGILESAMRAGFKRAFAKEAGDFGD